MGNFTIFVIHQRIYTKWHKEDETGGPLGGEKNTRKLQEKSVQKYSWNS